MSYFLQVENNGATITKQGFESAQDAFDYVMKTYPNCDHYIISEET